MASPLVGGYSLSSGAQQAERKIAWRILPFVFALYVLNFLDRVNLSYAAIDMSARLSFTPEIYGIGAGIFFFGYLVMEIPGALAVEHLNARVALSVMALAWGLVAGCTGFIQNAAQFYVARVALGLAEAGFFPGVIVYLSRWFPESQRTKTLAFLVVGLPVANLFASPLSATVLRIHWLGMDGWRWMFLLEAIPTIIVAVLMLWALPDRLENAHWLNVEERRAWSQRLAARSSVETSATRSSRQTLIMLSAAWLLFNLAVFGFTFWLPLLLKHLSGWGSSSVATIAAVPWSAALVATIAISRSSDARNERKFHAAVPFAVFGIGLALSVAFANRLGWALVMLCVAALGVNSGTASFWALCMDRLRHRSRAAQVGLITCFGAAGCFLGPYLMGRFSSQPAGLSGGLLCLSVASLFASAFVLAAGKTKRTNEMDISHET